MLTAEGVPAVLPLQPFTNDEDEWKDFRGHSDLAAQHRQEHFGKNEYDSKHVLVTRYNTKSSPDRTSCGAWTQEVSSCFHLSLDAAPRTRLAAAPRDVLWRWPPNWPQCWKTHTGLEWFVATRHATELHNHTQPRIAAVDLGLKHAPCVFSYFQFRSFKHWTGHRTWRRIDCKYVCVRVTSVWGQRWKKKGKGKAREGKSDWEKRDGCSVSMWCWCS